jgi:hypothetical protein
VSAVEERVAGARVPAPWRVTASAVDMLSPL